MAHYASVSARRPRHTRPRSRRVVILGHKVLVRTLLMGAAIAVAAGGALLAALLATS